MGSDAATRRYVVRRLHPTALLPLLALPAFVAFFGLSFPIWVLAVFGLLILWQVWSGSERLRVDADGVRLNRTGRSVGAGRSAPRTFVPWTSIRALIVFVPGVSDPAGRGLTELGVRLEPGAPLPSGVQAIVHDPRRPDEVPDALRLPLRSRSLDHNRLADAVRAHGDGVPLLEARDGSERQLTP